MRTDMVKTVALNEVLRNVMRDPEYAARLRAVLAEKMRENGVTEAYKKIKDILDKIDDVGEKARNTVEALETANDTYYSVENGIGGELRDMQLLEVAKMLEQITGKPIGNPISSPIKLYVFMRKLANKPEFWTASMTERVKILTLIVKSIEAGGTL